MGKLAKLPKLEDYKTPWEEKGEDVDPEKAKKFVHYWMRLGAEAADELADVKKERDALQTKLDEKTREGESEVEKRTREESEAKAAKAEVLKLEVAMDKGLTRIQAKRLVGNTREELEKDADDLLESFGGAGKPADDEGGDEGGDEGSDAPNTRPVRRATNAGDPKGHEQPQGGFDVSAGVDAYFADKSFA